MEGDYNYIYFSWIRQFWERVKDYIQDIVMPESTKEVFRVLTYSATEPATANDGDYYINSDENKLYVYDAVTEQWDRVNPNPDSVFVAMDTNHMYVIENGVYEDVTGTTVDNVIYTNNLVTGLDVTDAGMYQVCYTVAGSQRTEWYTLTVTRSTGPRRPGQPITVYYTQVLQNNEGFSARRKVGSGDWEDWTNNEYAYKKDIDDIMPLIYAGL